MKKDGNGLAPETEVEEVPIVSRVEIVLRANGDINISAPPNLAEAFGLMEMAKHVLFDQGGKGRKKISDIVIPGIGLPSGPLRVD